MKTKTILKLFTVIVLCLAMQACGKPEKNVPKVSNITFTECNEVHNTMYPNFSHIIVEFTATGLHITHYYLAVNCNFDTVLITQNLQNGILNITEQGEPNNANCICYTDVSYDISDISASNINTIIINDEVVWTANACNDLLNSETWVSVDNLPWENLKYDTVYVANSYSELLQHFYFAVSSTSIPVDFQTQSILINYFAGCAFCNVKSSFCNTNGYYWNIAYYYKQDIWCDRAEKFMVYKIVPKIPENANVDYHLSAIPCTNEQNADGNVLMLKVDFSTNTFEEGYEFSFDNLPSSFNIIKDYHPPGDFGYVKYFYDEIGAMLFYGTIHWMGEGQIYYPENCLPASAFQYVSTYDYVSPINGFENIGGEFPPDNDDYSIVWQNIQGLIKVREYLQANPEQKVKIFLYTPCVGIGDPEHWDWILFLKK